MPKAAPPRQEFHIKPLIWSKESSGPAWVDGLGAVLEQRIALGSDVVADHGRVYDGNCWAGLSRSTGAAPGAWRAAAKYRTLIHFECTEEDE
jgi:hypothetical protein